MPPRPGSGERSAPCARATGLRAVWFRSLYSPQRRQPRGPRRWSTFSAERLWPGFLTSPVSRFRPGGTRAAPETTSETQHGVAGKGRSREHGVRTRRRVQATLLSCGEVSSGCRAHGAEGRPLREADVLCPFRRWSHKDTRWSQFIQQRCRSVCSLNINSAALVKRAGSSPGRLSRCGDKRLAPLSLGPRSAEWQDPSYLHRGGSRTSNGTT